MPETRRSRSRGSNSKYTPERVERVLAAIALGATYRDACAYAGISEDTFARWRTRHADFAERIKKAEAQAVMTALAKIQKAAADGNWQAAAWWLERRYPADWGRRVVQSNVAGTVKVIVESVSHAPTDYFDPND